MKKVFLFTEKDGRISYLNKIVNKTLLEYAIIASNKASVDQVFLLDSESNEINDKVKNINASEIKNNIEKDDLLIFYSAHMPLVKAKILNKVFTKLEEGLDLVVEESDSISSLYGLKADILLEELDSEICVRKTLTKLRSKTKELAINIVKGSKQLFFVDSYETLSKADIFMRKSINKEYLKSGVFIENPETVTIEEGVEIGQGTVIETGVRILGNTKIGENCLIGFNTKIEDSEIHNNVRIFSSYIEKAIVEDNSDIGPFARLRPNAHLKKKVHIGNFVEVKNSIVGEGTKAGHLAYIGDADLGKDINVSCGVIFANYDGKFKHRSTVEDGAFIGSNVNIVSPVHIEKEGYIAAGSTVTKDVKAGYLVVERAERKDIEGYVERKKERDSRK